MFVITKKLIHTFYFRSAEETAKSVANEFKLRKRIFDSILTILQQFLGLTVFRILYGKYGSTKSPQMK